MKLTGSKLYRAMAMMCGLALALSFTACGDGEDDPDDPTPKPAKVLVSYSVILSQAYYDNFDITVTNDMSGSQDITTDWYLAEEYKWDEAPKTVTLKVVAKPKTTTPEFDHSKSYLFDCDCEVKATVYDSNDNVIGTPTSAQALNAFVHNGSTAAVYCASEVVLLDGSCNVTGK